MTVEEFEEFLELKQELAEARREINLRCSQIQQRDMKIAELTARFGIENELFD